MLVYKPLYKLLKTWSELKIVARFREEVAPHWPVQNRCMAQEKWGSFAVSAIHFSICVTNALSLSISSLSYFFL